MLLDLDRIRQAEVRSSPYPYFIVSGALRDATAADVARSFPAIDRPGALAVENAAYGPAFADLLDELRGEDLRRILADKLDVDLDGRDVTINVRGMVRLTDGNIHTDKPSKLVTVLLYFNQPGEAAGTDLRILRGGHDLDDVVEEVPPVLGSMLVFKVTPDCWHGHKPFVGKRNSLQLNYLSGTKSRGKHQLLHRLIGRMKRKLAAR
jgi:SM-20-related protein